jgi:serine protease Do
MCATLAYFTQPPSASGASPGNDLAHQLNQAFIGVASNATRFVVVIDVAHKSSASKQDGTDEDSSPLPPGYWRDFHRQFNPPKTQGKGSGVILTKDGYLLTNGHVVEDAESIRVRLFDGRTFPAAIQGIDRLSDLAVLKIDARELPTATFADSAAARIGEFTLAIGSPFSLDYTVTAGHLSAAHRTDVLPVGSLASAMLDQDFLQTDTPINPGNSGGPLLNLDGEVLGINTLIYGYHTGVGFAIPSNLARDISARLIADGRVTRAWLGVEIRTLAEEPPRVRQLLAGGVDGVVVRAIVPDGPAAKSELKPSDVITAVEGRQVRTVQQLRGEIRGKPIGKPVTLNVYRPDGNGQGKQIDIRVLAAEWKHPPTPPPIAESAPTAPPAAVGITVRSLTPDLAGQLELGEVEGVAVASVDKDSLAARAGIQPGDVITAINQQAVTNPLAFETMLKRIDLKKGAIFHFISGKVARFEILKAEK